MRKVFLSVFLAGFMCFPWAQDLSIQENDRCDICGMGIKRFPGPKAIIDLKGAHQLKFCSTREAFCFALKPENQSQVSAFYVHDIGKTDWEHPDDTAFTEAKNTYVVLGAKKRAVMGPAVATFGNQEEAQKFAAEFGGQVYGYQDLSTEFLRCRR